MAQTLTNDNNGMTFFGFQIRRAKDNLEPKSFLPADNQDGGMVVDTSVAGTAAYNSFSIEIDPTSAGSEGELVQRYRDISLVSDIDMAVDEIVNEVIIYDDQKQSVTLDFSEDIAKNISEKTKDIITEEFNEVLRMLNFQENASEIIRSAYVDGRIAYHKVLNKDNPKTGVIELRPFDVARLKRVVEVQKQKDPKTQVDVVIGQKEYYVYVNKGSTLGVQGTGLKISVDSVAYCTFGPVDKNSGNVLSYLHKAIRPLNQLRMMEDAEVINRLVRAPQRRIFYVDVNGMTKTKGEQHIRDVMSRYKNKQVYDAATGVIKDDKKHTSILEDIWLPRTSGGKATEITTLDGGGDLGSIENVKYFQNRLYQSLNIPISRLSGSQSTFNMGRENEISRDEIKFSKFIDKLRRKLNKLFLDVLETNIILKGIATSDDWEAIKPHLNFNYVADNFYAEIKDSEMLKERFMNVQLADQYVGKYISKRKIQRNIMRMTDKEIEDMEEENQEDAELQQQLESDVLTKYGIDPNNPTGAEEK
jgi:hypothetical protein